MKEFYSINEVAEMLGFKPRSVRQWVIDKKIDAVKIASEWRIPKYEVDRLRRGK